MKYWLGQVFCLLIFWGLGQLVSFFTGGYYPGSVIGMLLLFFALFFGIVKKESVEGICRLLQKHMALFFLCLVVGILKVTDVISGYGAIIVVAVVVSSFAVMAVVGHVAQYIEKRWKK